MTRKKRTTVHIQVKDPVTGHQIDRVISYVKDGCKFFFNGQHRYLALNRGERAFFDFLCEYMDERNRVMVDMQLRNLFSDFIEHVTSLRRSYKPGSATQYLKSLVEAGLLLQTGTNGFYIVNPKFVFAGTETSREKLLKTLIERRIREQLPIDALIDEPADVFLKRPPSQTG